MSHSTLCPDGVLKTRGQKEEEEKKKLKGKEGRTEALSQKDICFRFSQSFCTSPLLHGLLLFPVLSPCLSGFHGFFGSDRWSRFGVDSVEWTAENVIRHWEEKGEEEEEKEGRAAGHSRGKGLSN